MLIDANDNRRNIFFIIGGIVYKWETDKTPLLPLNLRLNKSNVQRLISLHFKFISQNKLAEK